MSRRPILVIHGGAGSRLHDARARATYRASLTRILQNNFPKLERGGSALSAVIQAVRELEDDPLYNAGKGSKIQSDGHIRMSASVMDGARGKFAGCLNVEGVKNPVRLAAALLSQQDRVLAGAGAKRFARERRLEMASPFTPAQRQRYRQGLKGKSGTVGAIALDGQGRLAAATSTGGRGFEYPGRVSDSATCAGNYASGLCAASATGIGEQIVEFAAASTVSAYMDAGLTLDAAMAKLFLRAKKQNAQFGLIALDRSGHICARFSTRTMVWASIELNGICSF